MRKWALLAAFAVMLTLVHFASSDSVHAGKPVSPVVVELFTSEGCSSCPPADRILREMQDGAVPDGVQVILLGEHVDYWNQLGWRDRFSSAQFSQRQSRYARQLGVEAPYTPQAVVDGHLDVLGNDEGALRKTIVSAAATAKPATVQIAWSNPEKLQVSVSGAPQSTVNLAITEDGLETDVRAGENGGRKLQHAAVVRQFQVLGKTSQGALQGEFPVVIGKDWKREKLHVIVIAQQEKGSIVGASSIQP